MKEYGFKEVNEEISAELTMTRAAEMEEWLTALEMEQDLSVAGMIDSVPDTVLTEEEEADLLLFANDDNPILAQAAQTLRMLSECSPEDLNEKLQAVPAELDCGEWLELHQQSITARVKPYVRYMKGSGYELDDLVQEANLAIFNGWDSYNPAAGTRANFAWFIIRNQMRELLRKELSQKRNFLLTESMDARVLGHSDFESSGFITWSSTAKQAQFESDFTLRDELRAAVATLEEEQQEIFSLLVDGYTQTEIGNILGRSQAGISYRVTEGRKALKEAIA